MIAPRSVATLEESLREAHAALRLGRAVTAERSLRALQAQFPGDANCQWLLGAAMATLAATIAPDTTSTLAMFHCFGDGDCETS